MFLANRFCRIGSGCPRFRRFLSIDTDTRSFALEQLTGRGLIRLRGEMVQPFLQDLITNDINHLNERSNSIYAMFLNKNGRVLYDSILYKPALESDNSVLIECDNDSIIDLKKHITIFRIRKKIDIDIVDELKVWAAFNRNAYSMKTERNTNALCLPEIATSDVIACPDPRLKHLGTRIIANDVDQIQATYPQYQFDQHEKPTHRMLRYRLGIAEGTTELPIAKCFPLESNCDYLHGVSFHKGCYLGQELTARTYHTGIIRKRLMPLFLSNELKHNCSLEIKTNKGDALGKLRSFDGNCGIGLLKIETALKETEPFLLDSEETKIEATTEKPFWWSVEAPTLQELREKGV